MKVNISEFSEGSYSTIKNAVQNNQAVEFFSYTLTKDVKEKYQKLLEIFLQESDNSHLYNCLSYVILELLDNASKANAKRIYFKEKNLNINDAEDYQTGMKNFKAEISENTKHYLSELEAGLLDINLLMTADSTITIKVTNNTPMAKVEKERIENCIKRCSKYESMADALIDIDNTEGAGLGIVSIVLMLRRFGVEENAITFTSTEKETVVTIEIPNDSLLEII